MSQSNFGLKAFKTGAAVVVPLAAYARVKQDAAADAAGFTGTVTLAGPNDEALGQTEQAVQRAGDHVTVKTRNYPGTRKVICASVCAIGDRLYPTASGLVDTRAASGLGTAGGALGPCEYIALEASTVAGGIVEALPVGLTARGLLFTSTSDSATITNTVAETTFTVNQTTIPANTLKVGDVLRLRARVVIPLSNGADTLTLRLKLGAVTLMTVAAFDPAAANDEVYITADFVVTAIGGAGSINGGGIFAFGILGTATARHFALAATALDTTIANLLSMTAQWSAASAGSTTILRNLIVELIRQ